MNGEPLIDHSNCIDNPNPCGMPFTIGSERGYRWVYLLEGPVVADSYEWYLAATEMNTAANRDPSRGDRLGGRRGRGRPVAHPRPTPVPRRADRAPRRHQLGHDQAGDAPLPCGPKAHAPRLVHADHPGRGGRERVSGGVPGALLLAPLQVHLRHPPAAGGPRAGNADYLDFVIDPASGVVMPERGQWVTVTGSFDLPNRTRAATCPLSSNAGIRSRSRRRNRHLLSDRDLRERFARPQRTYHKRHIR